MIDIRRASIENISEVAPLFDAYRVFYKQPTDMGKARAFLEARAENKESVIFVAYFNDQAVGFTQLFTTFSSVSLQAFFILNDLFVAEAFRKKGIAEMLLNRAKKHCIEMKYKGLALETALDNPAQKLYERLGWKKDLDYFHYFWAAD